MVPIADGNEPNRSRRTVLEFNVASLNVLAESYLTPRSHPGLPEKYAETAFNSGKRRELLLSTLERYCGGDSGDNTACKPADQKWDVLALQELDLLRPEEEILPAFERWGYQVVQTINEQRKDCCAIAFDRKRFELVRYDVVQFDDLASLYTDSDTAASPEAEGQARSVSEDRGSGVVGTNDRKRRDKNAPMERIEMGQGKPLSGMVRSFLRRNCAIVAQLRSVDSGKSFVVASVHLYWNPGYEYVKLCQSRYLLDRVAAFASSAEGSKERLPTVICGDTNSKPGSVVHQYFVRPHVDARAVAPWRYFWDRDAEEVCVDEDDSERKEDEPVEVSGPMADMSLADKPYRINDGNDVDISALWKSIHMKKRNGKKKKKAVPQSPPGGYMMAGLPDQFNAMYCGEISPSCEETIKVDEKKSAAIEVGTTAAITTPSLENLSSGENLKTDNRDTAKAVLEQCNTEKADATSSPRAANHDPHISPQDYEHSISSPPVKYMLDYTLNRFTRWLRILGIDATLETMEEEKERTNGGRIALFERCRKEKRTLLTTSYKLLLRKDCPAGAYLLDPKSTESLEAALPCLLKTHGVDLVPRTFLTRCVVCNGNIVQVDDDATKKKVFVDHGAPALAKSDEVFEVFQCDTCAQGYWWDRRPNSSASRVLAQATKLFRLCLRGGVALQCEKIEKGPRREKAMGAFSFVDVESERKHVDSNSSPRELSVINWLRQDKLQNPYSLKSAYALNESKDDRSIVRESLPFTNVTSEFVGCLDYIFYESSHFDQVSRLNVPTSFRDMNNGEANSHLLPSDVWPSDHIAVGARLRLNGQEVDKSTEKVSVRTPDKTKSPLGHPDRCKCGCIPNILSMFEMAELRKKHREEMKRKKALEGVA